MKWPARKDCKYSVGTSLPLFKAGRGATHWTGSAQNILLFSPPKAGILGCLFGVLLVDQ